MAEKDIMEKVLESYNDVFADIANVLLFQGERIILPEELEERQPHSYYKASGKIREVERDVAKIWRNGKIRIAFVGYENQTNVDPDMPLRIMGYDGAEYRAQLTKEEDSRHPVVTLVLYFGYTRRWDKAKNLLGRLDVPEKLKPFVSDYKINVFEIAYLSREQVNLFQSDFRAVADYFVQMQENGSYKPEPQKLRHIQETLQLLSVMTGDHRYEDAYHNRDEEGRPNNMCEVLDAIEKRGYQQGIQQGTQDGVKLGRAEREAQIILNMYKNQIPMQQIAASVERSVDEIREVIEGKKKLLS